MIFLAGCLVKMDVGVRCPDLGMAFSLRSLKLSCRLVPYGTFRFLAQLELDIKVRVFF